MKRGLLCGALALLSLLVPGLLAYISSKPPLDIFFGIGNLWHQDLTRVAFGYQGSGLDELALCLPSETCEYPDIYKFNAEIRNEGMSQPVITGTICGVLLSCDVSDLEDAHFHPARTALYWQGNDGLWQIAMDGQYRIRSYSSAYRSLGYMVHLAQDATVPAHAKTIWHGPAYAYLEYATGEPLPVFLDGFNDPHIPISDNFEKFASNLSSVKVVSSAQYARDITALFNSKRGCAPRTFWLDYNHKADPDSYHWGAYSMLNVRGCDLPTSTTDRDWFRDDDEQKDEDLESAANLAREGLYVAMLKTKELLIAQSKRLPPLMRLTTPVQRTDLNVSPFTLNLEIEENRSQRVSLNIVTGLRQVPIRARVNGSSPQNLNDAPVTLTRTLDSDKSYLPFLRAVKIEWNGDLADGSSVGAGSPSLLIDVVDQDGNHSSYDSAGNSIPGATISTTTDRSNVVCVSPITPGTAANGQLVPGCRSLRRIESYYRSSTFNAAAGQAITAFAAGTGLDVFAYLLDPAGHVVALDDDSGADRNALIRHIAATGGIYTLEVTSFSPAIVGNVSATVTLGATPFGPLEGVWDSVEHTTAGARALRRLRIVQYGSALYVPLQDISVGDEPANGGGISSGTFTSNRVSISFRATDVDTGAPSTATLVGALNSAGDTITGTVTYRYDGGSVYSGTWQATKRKLRARSFRFDGAIRTPGDRVDLAFWAPRGSVLTGEVFAQRNGSDLDSILYILKADGLTVVASNDDAIGSDSRIDNVLASEYAGESQLYYLEVRGYDDSTGLFTVSLSITPPISTGLPISATRVTLPVNITGAISVPTGVDVYGLDLNQGITLDAEITAARRGSRLDSTLALLDTDGITELAINDDTLDLDSAIRNGPPGPGRYFLVVQNVGSSAGPNYFYTMTANQVFNASSPQRAESLVCGDCIGSKRPETGVMVPGNRTHSKPPSRDKKELLRH